MKKKMLLIAILSAWIISIHAQTPGNSLHFDGTNDYITTSLPAVFTNLTANDFTVEAWIKPQGSTFSRVLFAQLSTSNFFSLTLSATRSVYFYLNNTVGLVTSASLTFGQWSHVACTWKASTSEAKIYINGVLQTGTSGGTSSTGSNNMMAIGSRTDGSQYFNGELDELRIWDVVRNQCEITRSMNSEYTIAQPNLVAYYKFNQGVAGGTNTTVITLDDFTTNHNGTLNNFALTGSISNWLASAAVINQVNPGNSIDVINACDSIVWIDGITYTASNNTATHTIPLALGCDSIITLNLTISYSPATTDIQTACDSFLWIDGITYTASNNTATHTIPLALGCDSIITLDLTINYSAATTDIQNACDSFLWINGITYTAGNNTATHTLSTVAGCDSIITLDLTINTVDVSVTVADPVISANETGATYQWLDCTDNFAVITGETSQVFTATANGVYAVEVTKNGCTDTSVCVTIATVGLKENDFFEGVSFFPNPNQGIVNINFGSLKDVSIKAYSIHGRLIYNATNINSSTHTFEFDEAPGVYIIEVSSQGNKQLYRMVKD